jgi:hypothetical protein
MEGMSVLDPHLKVRCYAHLFFLFRYVRFFRRIV